MIGKLISVENMTDRYDEVKVLELESDALLTGTVDKGSCDYYIGKYIEIYTSVVKLANANAGHSYPEGTLGWDKKGI